MLSVQCSPSLAGSEDLDGMKVGNFKPQVVPFVFHVVLSTSCQNSSMNKWRNCTFLHSVRRPPSLLSPVLGRILKQSRRTHVRSIVGGRMFGFTHDGVYHLRWDSVKLLVGEGQQVHRDRF